MPQVMVALAAVLVLTQAEAELLELETLLPRQVPLILMLCKVLVGALELMLEQIKLMLAEGVVVLVQLAAIHLLQQEVLVEQEQQV
jgi:hypothetical protein